MSNNNKDYAVKRRQVLRQGAFVGSGLLVGDVLSGGRAGVVAAERDSQTTEYEAYMSVSSYRHIVGADPVDCAPGSEGWGESFTLQREARDGDGDSGVFVDVSASCDGDGSDEQIGGYLVTAGPDTDCDGGPSGDGPWLEDCCTWLFVDADLPIETQYRITEVRGPDPPAPCHEAVQPHDGDGEPLGAPLDLVWLSVAPVEEQEDQWTQTAKFAGDEVDRFGTSVALDGDTGIGGAPLDAAPDEPEAGSAAVLGHSEDDWRRLTTLTAADGDEGDRFGRSVDVDGNTVVVGAWQDEDPNGASSGSAYVFARSGDDWSQQAKLVPDDGEANDEFGSSVAVDGDTVVVGAESDRTPRGRNGSAYVFTRSEGEWHQQARLTADRAQIFGETVAVEGDTVVVGARATGIESFERAGSAYVFTRSGSEWSQQTKLVADDPGQEHNFGNAVAINDETVLVGSRNDDSQAEPFSRYGSAYVFTRSGDTWSQQAKLTSEDVEPPAWFGYSVAVDGDTAFVGSDIFEGVGTTARGEVFVFTRSEDGWSQRARLTADDGSAGDKFGSSVAVDGPYALVGAPGDGAESSSESGSVYVFER